MLSDIKTLGKDTLVYGLSTVVARLLNFLLLPFYTHFLAPGEYGVVAIVFSYIAFLNIVFQYGMDQAYLSVVRKGGEAKARTCFSTSQWALGISTAAMASLILLFAEPLARMAALGPGDVRLIRYAACILALDAMTLVPFTDLRVRRKTWTFAGVKTFHITVNVVMNVLLLAKFGLGVRGVFIASLIASSASLILLTPVFADRMRWKFDRKLFGELLGFGLPFIPAGIGAMMVQVIDRPILQHLTDEATVGIYQANYRLGIFMMLIVTMFDQAWRPFLFEKAGGAESRRLYGRVLTYFLGSSMLFVAALSLFIGDIVRFPLPGGQPLIHPDYWGGLSVIPIVLTAYIFHGAYINFMASILLAKRTDLLIWVTLLGAVVNIGANFLLIPIMGMNGAAWATFAAYASMAACLYAMGRRVYPIPYEYGRIVHLLMAGAVLSGAAFWLSGVWGESGGAAWAGVRMLLLALFPALLYGTGFFTQGELKPFGKLL